MRLLALTRYGGRAASTRQRLLQFIPALEEAHIETYVSPLFDDDYMDALARRERVSAAYVARSSIRRAQTLLTIQDYDCVWLQYEAYPYAPAAIEKLFLKRAKRLVIDFDDAIFHRYDRHKNPLVRAGLSDKISRLMERADLCIAGNAYLEEYARAYTRNTIVIPTVVDTDRYLTEPRSPNPAPVVGWMGSPSTYAQLLPTLTDLAEHRASLGVTFSVIGSGLNDSPLPGVTSRDWSEQTEVSDIAAMDIGVMPLPDDPWSRGKCGYKLIQYMAAGLPVVASPVGVNADIVEHGVNGFLASTPAQWRAAIADLAGDADLRARMGAAGRRKVIERYSLRAQAPRFVAALKSVRSC